MRLLLVLALLFAAWSLHTPAPKEQAEPAPESATPAAASPIRRAPASPAPTPAPGAWMWTRRGPLDRGAHSRSGPGESWDTHAAAEEARDEAARARRR